MVHRFLVQKDAPVVTRISVQSRIFFDGGHVKLVDMIHHLKIDLVSIFSLIGPLAQRQVQLLRIEVPRLDMGHPYDLGACFVSTDLHVIVLRTVQRDINGITLFPFGHFSSVAG